MTLFFKNSFPGLFSSKFKLSNSSTIFSSIFILLVLFLDDLLLLLFKSLSISSEEDGRDKSSIIVFRLLNCSSSLLSLWVINLLNSFGFLKNFFCKDNLKSVLLFLSLTGVKSIPATVNPIFINIL